ncbi:hypothetical protein SeMB42_g05147 [Synchytrium endobioticum]|uniref:Uncharacterized protein n=1 Tax=Synchytrium endobioticum TaxID=286115 RepID=A0A507CZ73_9FUNG|nr:hypothetical protein SeMB42_g05147 [Synchytrium endobioticum]TPX44517.1 hypothetical protein SeLEV6574_g04451 [Synchytrium endobioticum]
MSVLEASTARNQLDDVHDLIEILRDTIRRKLDLKERLKDAVVEAGIIMNLSPSAITDSTSTGLVALPRTTGSQSHGDIRREAISCVKDYSVHNPDDFDRVLIDRDDEALPDESAGDTPACGERTIDTDVQEQTLTIELVVTLTKVTWRFPNELECTTSMYFDHGVARTALAFNEVMMSA